MSNLSSEEIITRAIKAARGNRTYEEIKWRPENLGADEPYTVPPRKIYEVESIGCSGYGIVDPLITDHWNSGCDEELAMIDITAGVTLLWTLPQNARWQIDSVIFDVACDGTVKDRLPYIEFIIGGYEVFVNASASALTATQSRRIIYTEMPTMTEVLYDARGFRLNYCPARFIMKGGDMLFFGLIDRQVGDLFYVAVIGKQIRHSLILSEGDVLTPAPGTSLSLRHRDITKLFVP